ncbi:branched-chain amino acid ABC transporter permease [Microbacterium sp. X-17]|uniref:branched-chain amino acid ABC transporter permease n=1 Tax=Microbacterium sp. X-17 TaxID=3144404 RepID=UPI0031F4F6C2
MTIVVDALTQGASAGAILLLTSLGLTVIYGVMGVVNLAHGEFVMLGAYSSVLLTPIVGPWLAIAAAPVAVGAFGAILDRIVIKHLYRNPVRSMLGTFALALILRQLITVIVGPGLQYSAPPIGGSFPLLFGAEISTWRLLVTAAAVTAAVAVGLWLARTKLGLGIRLTASDHEMAQMLGLKTNRLSAVTFLVGAALAGFAGALIAPLASVSPDMGNQYLVDAFLIVVLAGLGNVRGAVVWSVIVGVATAAIAIPFDNVIAQVATWAAALVIVSVRTRTRVRV